MLEYDEQRCFFRMMVNSDCVLSINDEESSRTVSAICRDLSATGMSLELDEPIEAGTQVDTKLESTNTQIPSLMTKSKVVRCTQQSDSSYIVGVEILEML